MKIILVVILAAVVGDFSVVAFANDAVDLRDKEGVVDPKDLKKDDPKPPKIEKEEPPPPKIERERDVPIDEIKTSHDAYHGVNPGNK